MPTEANQPVRTVRNQARRQEREIRPFAAINRQVFNGRVVDVAGKVRRDRVDRWGFVGNLDRLGGGAKFQTNLELGDSANFDDQARGPIGRKRRRFDRHFVLARGKRCDAEVAEAVRRAGLLLVSCEILNGYCGVGHHRLKLVADRAANSASRI